MSPGGPLGKSLSAASLLVVFALAACTGAPLAVPGGSSATSVPSHGAPAPTPSTQSQARVEIMPAARSTVAPDAQVRVRAVAGRLTSVVVRPKSGGQSLVGTLSVDGSSWTVAPGMLRLATTYVVKVRAVDQRGVERSVSSSFATLRPKSVLKTSVTPGDGALVGVGMPIMVSFSAPVTNRAAVEGRLHVTLSHPVEGSWHWFSSRVVHFRPKSFWPAGEHVKVELDLAGVDAGNGVWGERDRSYAFTIGDSLVSTVDITRHTMTVRRNGHVLRVIPITTGKTGYLTRGGIKVVMTKERFRVMDSTTVDIPADSPDAYRLKVEYALRLTYSGEFVHAAPWSVSHQGHSNVSHGCTGMSLANAAWFYGISQLGDVVTYVHSTRTLEQGNGYTDWNISWASWAKGSAL